MLKGRDCCDRVASGECNKAPIAMASACKGFCDDLEVPSEKRGRKLTESVISADLAKSVLDLATEATVVGDGYGGNAQPGSRLEIFSGLTPVAAAQWALS